MKILLYVEPHPIRDSFEEFSGIGTFLAEALLAEKKLTPFDLRIFSNNAVVDLICNAIPSAAMICERPSGQESKQIEHFKSAWGKQNIDTWIDLTKAEGPATDLYMSILNRIYDRFKFDAVVLWSENGAVRKFCETRGIIALHGELGPTRPPFEETMYFDPNGTNGNASVRNANLQDLVLKNLPPETWLGQKSRLENNPDGIGIIDVPYTAVPDEFSLSIKFPYIFVPLQLADDLNTIKNSEFTGPLDFLQKTLPAFIEQGYNVVIKPHPGSIARPYNLIEETKALAYARTCGEKIVIVDRKVTITRSQRLIAQASYVCTINSSVGYEAMLLGKQPLIMGDAIYDVGGTLKVSLTDIANLDGIKHDKAHIKCLVNFFSGHFLIQKSSVSKGKPIIEILKFLLEANNEKHKNKTDQDTYWSKWIDNFQYGLNWLGPLNPKPSASIDVSEIFGNIELFSTPNKFMRVEQGLVYVDAVDKNVITVTGAATLSTSLFVGHIDEHIPSTTMKNGTTLRGWAIDDKLRQVALVLVIHEGKVITHEHRATQRQDASDFIRSQMINAASKSVPSACGFQVEVDIDPSRISECTIALLSADNTVSIYDINIGLLQAKTNIM